MLSTLGLFVAAFVFIEETGCGGPKIAVRNRPLIRVVGVVVQLLDNYKFVQMILYFTLLDIDAWDEANGACVDTVGVDEHAFDCELIISISFYNTLYQTNYTSFDYNSSAAFMGRARSTIGSGVQANDLDIAERFVVFHGQRRFRLGQAILPKAS